MCFTQSKTQACCDVFISFNVHLFFMKPWLAVILQLNDPCTDCRLSVVCGKLHREVVTDSQGLAEGSREIIISVAHTAGFSFY